MDSSRGTASSISPVSAKACYPEGGHQEAASFRLIKSSKTPLQLNRTACVIAHNDPMSYISNIEVPRLDVETERP